MLTFSEMDMASLYAHMGYSSEQIAVLGSFDPFSLPTLTFISCAWGIRACIYLVWVRDCFRAEKESVEVKSYQQRKAEENAGLPKASVPRIRMRLD